MRFCKRSAENPDAVQMSCSREDCPDLPDTLTDYLTGAEIPFTNKDNIRQKILRFLIENRGFLREDISVDREISFTMEDMQVSSPVDIAVRLNRLTLMVWKCSSGSLVSRERQIIASSRLLESYVVPFAAVTNGSDVALLDTATEKVVGSGFGSIPTRQELLNTAEALSLRIPNSKKLIYEQRILYTYDVISCPISSGHRSAH